MARFEEIMSHMPQLDAQDHKGENPHRAGQEGANDVSGQVFHGLFITLAGFSARRKTFPERLVVTG